MNPLQRARARKLEIETRLDALVSLAETETRDFSAEESTELDGLTAEHRTVKERIASLEAADEARSERARVDPVDRAVTTEERTAPYAAGGSESYFKDLYLANHRGNRGAQDRLERNDKHRNDQARHSKVTEVRAMSTGAGVGGEFAPPLWQIESFVGVRRPNRPLADSVSHDVLPEGVSSINLPKVTTGTLTGEQTTQNTAVANRDMATDKVSGTVKTVAGRVIVSRQELDQTPINLDQVILADLERDYDMQLDAAVIAGVVAAAGNVITLTDASPTTLKVLNAVQQGIDAIHTGLLSPAKAVFMRPDRWGRFIAAGDANGRPFVLPSASYGAHNALGQANGQTAQGPAGDVRGLPAILDASIPANLGAGTNQDEILILDPAQIWLYESATHAETFEQTYADQLSVLFRFYRYYSLIANRLPKAISVVVGTGMVPQAYGV